MDGSLLEPMTSNNTLSENPSGHENRQYSPESAPNPQQLTDYPQASSQQQEYPRQPPPPPYIEQPPEKYGKPPSEYPPPYSQHDLQQFSAGQPYPQQYPQQVSAGQPYPQQYPQQVSAGQPYPQLPVGSSGGITHYPATHYLNYTPPVQQQQQQTSVVVLNRAPVVSQPVVYESYTKHIWLACFVTWCCFIVFGKIAFILASK